MKVYVYLIKSEQIYWYYTGISDDPLKRLKEHNSGKSKSTAKYRPFILVYTKAYDNYSEARRHEKWLKKKDVAYKDMLVKVEHPAHKGRGKLPW